jgi:anaerobic selenocysteine-containing dehydrogenase
MSNITLFAPISTLSGRFEIYSNQLAEECYYNPESRWQSNQHVYPLPTYIPIAEPKGNDEFYLLCGKAAWHQKSATQQNRYLMEYAIEGECAYTAIHINADRARKLGIQDGDLVEVECIGPTKADDPCVLNDAVIGTKEVARAKVTEGLHPKAVWVYFAGSHRSNSMLPKAREGITHNWFVPTSVTPYAAGLGKNYSIVKVRKID